MVWSNSSLYLQNSSTQTKKSCSNFSSQGPWELTPESKPTSSLLSHMSSLQTSKTVVYNKTIPVHFKTYKAEIVYYPDNT